MLLPALLMVAPLVLQIHTGKAAALADGEAGRALLRAHFTNQESSKTLLKFFEDLCPQYSQREDFLKHAIPDYAKHIVNGREGCFLPVKDWPAWVCATDDDECTRALMVVWNHCGSADLHRNRGQLYSVLNNATKEYLVEQQQQQNREALQEGYAAPLWFVLTGILAFYLAGTWAMPKGESDGGDVKDLQ